MLDFQPVHTQLDATRLLMLRAFFIRLLAVVAVFLAALFVLKPDFSGLFDIVFFTALLLAGLYVLRQPLALACQTTEDALLLLLAQMGGFWRSVPERGIDIGLWRLLGMFSQAPEPRTYGLQQGQRGVQELQFSQIWPARDAAGRSVKTYWLIAQLTQTNHPQLQAISGRILLLHKPAQYKYVAAPAVGLPLITGSAYTPEDFSLYATDAKDARQLLNADFAAALVHLAKFWPGLAVGFVAGYVLLLLPRPNPLSPSLSILTAHLGQDAETRAEKEFNAILRWCASVG